MVYANRKNEVKQLYYGTSLMSKKLVGECGKKTFTEVQSDAVVAESLLPFNQWKHRTKKEVL